jgi:hypothetical protein
MNDVFEAFVKKRNTIELLEFISLSNLIPLNHGKNIRLEIIQSIIINNLNTITKSINVDGVINILTELFPSDYREDPAETSFTENFQFFNGNNIVFPGLANNSTETVDLLVKAILQSDNDLPKEVKQLIHDGLLFMLFIHNEIAKELNLERYITFKNDGEIELCFLSEDEFKKHKDLFEFSLDKIVLIYEKLGIQNDVIKYFVFDRTTAIDYDDVDNNPILLKPFIEYNGNYYLIAPTTQMYCLNEFILNILKDNNLIEIGEQLFDDVIIFRTISILKTMHWLPTDITEKFKDKIPFTKNESLWQFDENKLAYVYVIPNSIREEAKYYDKLIDCRISLLKELVDPNFEFFPFFIFSNISTKEITFLTFEKIKNSTYQFAVNLFDLERLVSFWDIDELSLWKYCKSKDRAIEKKVEIMPFYSILTYYKWYVRNQYSFFESDSFYNGVSFSYDIQGEIVMETNFNSDKHLVKYIDHKKGVGYIPVYKSEKYLPIYQSEEINFGKYSKVIEVFKFPVWISLSKGKSSFGIHFIDAIAFWLLELSKDINEKLNVLGYLPIEIIIEIDEKYNSFNSEDFNKMVEKDDDITYDIIPKYRKILFYISIDFYIKLHKNDNSGEQYLMQIILEAISKLQLELDLNNIYPDVIKSHINNNIPIGPAKMILTADSSYNLKMDNRFIPRTRYISKADTSIVLEELVTWMNLKNQLPEKITDKKEKLDLFVKCVVTLISKLREELHQYDYIELIKFLMYHHEAIIQVNEFRKIHIPAKIACFSKYNDIIKEYRDTESEIVNSSLAYRSLIEFIVAETFNGNKKPNKNDVDLLLAIMDEILYFGALQDMVKFEINNPEVELLPSGRIGVSKEFFTDTLSEYYNSNIDDEIVDYKSNFKKQFKNKTKTIDVKEKKIIDYYKRLDEIFIETWGITLPQMDDISNFLAEHCITNEKSYCILDEKNIYKLIKDNSDYSEETIRNYFAVLSLESRGKMDVPPEGSEYSEIYPWRYNRMISYLRKPIIKLKNDKSENIYVWSARFLIKATDNLTYLFYDGSLKLPKEHTKLQNLLAGRNHHKGKEFRNEVTEWLDKNTDLEVINFEVKIKKKGILNAIKNYGDIDILAFDHKNKYIYCIECKNTKQAKVIYDFQRDINNYLNKQLPKHINRGKWLEENKEQLNNKFKNSFGDYDVKTLVISSYQLPVKFTTDIEIPLYSFNEVKAKKIF